MKLYHRKCMLKRKDRIIGTLLEIVNLFHHFQSITLKASGLEIYCCTQAAEVDPPVREDL